jgi:hypothetical protein
MGSLAIPAEDSAGSVNLSGAGNAGMRITINIHHPGYWYPGSIPAKGDIYSDNEDSSER